MIAICEECGTKHKFEPAIIRANKARFNCKRCNLVITVIRPVENQAIHSPSPTFKESKKPISVIERKTARAKKSKSFNLDNFRLRGKMFVLFLLIPIVLIIGTNILFLEQMNNLSSFLTSESSDIVRDLIEEKVADSARKVAAECKLYLESHPEMKKEDLNKDKKFKKIAIQKLGKTGYSTLYGKDTEDIWKMWVYVDPRLVGVDMIRVMKKPLGKYFDPFFALATAVEKGGESKGYYHWPQKDGSFGSKFMVCTPVEGTSLFVAASTFVHEFTEPVRLLETKATKQTKIIRNIVFGIFGGSILLIGFIVMFFGYRLSGRIQSLTDTANRISVGELDAEIEISGKDEIFDLGEAISRMQYSIRLAMDRLRGNR